MKSPCRDCNKRSLACHDKCLDKLEYDVMYKPVSKPRDIWGASIEAKKGVGRGVERSKHKRRNDTKSYLTGQNISYITHLRTDIAIEN